MTTLFDTLKLGDLTLKNRIVMAPLTRARCEDDRRIPNDLMASYYAQRAGFGMILTEATSVEPMGVGYAFTPGIWSEEQVEGWKKITKAVHEKSGIIFLQLWHVGRISDPIFLNGKKPVAPSAIAAKGHVSLVRPEKPYERPRALEISEIKDIVKAYKVAAENAKRAGFDGVEIHGANGYLLDQFMHESTNKRVDEYGGGLENRCRLILEVTDACIAVWGASRVGVHLAPRGDSHDLSDSNPKELFGHVVKELDKREIAFIFTREYLAEDSLAPYLKNLFRGAYIANEKLTKENAEKLLKEKQADAVSFGLMAISNPDLPQKLRESAPLKEVNFETLYARGSEGYTDY